VNALIKGHVKMYDRYIPVTWERETKKHVYNVRKVTIQSEIVLTDKRLFEEKIPKKEIIWDLNPKETSEVFPYLKGTNFQGK
jgi:hypothetical protein